MYLYLWLIPIVVWQEPTQHCKAIILQLKSLKIKIKSIVVLDLLNLRCLSVAQVKMPQLEGKKKKGDVMENYGGRGEGSCLFFPRLQRASCVGGIPHHIVLVGNKVLLPP